MNKDYYDERSEGMNKTVLITGASSGFGYLTAIKCAEKGFRVIATMRNLEKAHLYDSPSVKEEIRNRIEIWPLDVTKDTSLTQFKEKLHKLKQIDVLINNAGYAMGGFVEQISIEEYRKQFETNFFGQIRVTQAVLPLMRNKNKGKILNVSSISGLIGFPGLSSYASSKHALEGWSESLRLEVKPFGIDVALIQPGSYQTNIWSSGMELPDNIYDPDSPYAHYIKGLTNVLNDGPHRDPVHVANVISRLSSQTQLKKLRYPVGVDVRVTILLKRVLPWVWLERIVLKKLLK